ncbi:MAG: hypothetical protein RLZZ299_1905 [Pseudomonadota bacterium]
MVAWLVLLACKDPVAPTPETEPGGWIGEGLLNPFPTMELVRDGHLAIPAGALPVPSGGTALDVARLNWRDGFSPVQASVVRLGVALDPASVPGESRVGLGGAVRMVDLDSGVELPCFAELDIHPDAVADPARQALIVRPQVAMPPGHRVAVVLTPQLLTADGAPLSVPGWEAAKQDREDARALSGDLAALGITEVALAWDFPVGDARPLLQDVLVHGATPQAHAFTRVADADQPGGAVSGAWKTLEGTFTTTNWLVDDTRFEVDDDGMPVVQGEAEADLFVHVPDAVRGARAGTVPVLVFGHGILGHPADYLRDPDDVSRMIDLSNRMGAIVVATTWRGLTERDRVAAIDVARDFGSFPDLTDKLVQGVANTVALIRYAQEGDLLEDERLMGLGDPTDIRYVGISLGAIEGAVTLAAQSRVTRGVLHVGGSTWGTMLERSSNWSPFELFVVQSVPDPWERQVLYATSQLLWDPVDPAIWTEQLASREILWQEAIGDNQVPNMTTELLVRSLGAPVAEPLVDRPWGMTTTALPATGPVLVQFDPEVGLPDPGNRPADNTRAHDLPRRWEGTVRQAETFLRQGVARHYCGETVCSAQNPGE